MKNKGNKIEFDPYETMNDYISNNFQSFIQKVKKDEIVYSINKAKNITNLFIHLGKSEDDILLFLKTIKIKEFKNFNLFIDDSIDRIAYINDSKNKDYYIEELKDKTKTFQSINFQNNDLNPKEVIVKAEKEFITVIQEMYKRENHQLFFDDIEKLKSIVVISDFFLKSKKIDNIKDLNLKQEKHFIFDLLNNKNHIKIKKEKLHQSIKQKIKQKINLKHKPKLKKP